MHALDMGDLRLAKGRERHSRPLSRKPVISSLIALKIVPAAAGLCGPLTWMSSVAPGVSRDARSMPRDPSDAPGVPREDPRTRPRHDTASWRGPAARHASRK